MNRPQRAEGLISLLGGWRLVLPAAMVLLAAALVFAPSRVTQPPFQTQSTPTTPPTTPAPPPDRAAAPLPTPVGRPADLSKPAGSMPTALPSPTVRAATATPTPPPNTGYLGQAAGPGLDASRVRPLAGPVMPQVSVLPSGPRRKPGAADPDPSTDHVVVVDGATGALLFQRRAQEPIAPASLTKIMTAILGIEHGNLSEKVKVDVDARTMAGSTLMGLEPWFDVTFRDLLYGMMLPSGNDAALAIARYVAGNDENFVQLMNAKARWLGLTCTRFANPHGLDEPGHHSCPADMVTMARYAMQYPIFREVVAARRYEVRSSNLDLLYYNINAILGLYPGADGVKTGFTDDAGRAIVATASQDGRRVFVAMMRSRAGTTVDGSLLLDWAFNAFEWPGDGAPRLNHPQ